MRRFRNADPRAMRLDAHKAAAHRCPLSVASRSSSFSARRCTASVSWWQALNASKSSYADTRQRYVGEARGKNQILATRTEKLRTVHTGGRSVVRSRDRRILYGRTRIVTWPSLAPIGQRGVYE